MGKRCLQTNRGTVRYFILKQIQSDKNLFIYYVVKLSWMRGGDAFNESKTSNFYPFPSKSYRENSGEWEMTLKYCKIEVTVILTYVIAETFVGSFGAMSNFFFKSNAFELPIPVCIIVLPINGTLLNWIINYAS